MALIDEISVFLIEQGMTRTRFGRLAVSDQRLIDDMQRGRDLSAPMEMRVRGFMQNYRAGLIANIPAKSEPRPRRKVKEEKLLLPHNEKQREESLGNAQEILFRNMMTKGCSALLEAVLRELSTIQRRNRQSVA